MYVQCTLFLISTSRAAPTVIPPPVTAAAVFLVGATWVVVLEGAESSLVPISPYDPFLLCWRPPETKGQIQAMEKRIF